MDLSFLPVVNASLNAISATLLIVGLVMIRRQRIAAHQKCMTAAIALSVLFLVLYVLHKYWKYASGQPVNSTFNAQGGLKTLYLLILFTHLILAMTVPFFAGRLLYLGLKRRDREHRRLARIGYPIWMYVAVTGVVIYFMLYPFNPDPLPEPADTPTATPVQSQLSESL